MNWTEELYDLYEKNMSSAGIIQKREIWTKDGIKSIPYVLLPISHSTAKAQIQVTIDTSGNFLRAEKVPEDDDFTIIQVTEKSACRTNSPEAHAFCDCLKYIAGDYRQYFVGKKDKGEYSLYISQLEKWHNSPYSHEKVDALYTYLRKGMLINDLVKKADILIMDESGRIDENAKINGVKQADAFVRFRIERTACMDINILEDNTGKYRQECWLDRTLFDSYIEYYSSQETEKGLCYLTGEETFLSEVQPKKIRSEGDGTKLISSNDEKNFTFLGRFTTKQEAFGIGYQAAQKIHDALKWIIRKQGYIKNELCIVVWESDLQPLPKWDKNTDELCVAYETEGWGDENQEQMEGEEDGYGGTDEIMASRFRKAMEGYGQNLGDTSRTVQLSLEAASPGRLSMTGFHDFQTQQYIENIQYWHESCKWRYVIFKDDKPYTYVGMTGVKEIILALFGTEDKKSGRMSIPGKNNKIATEVSKRLLPCISRRKKLPGDYIRLAIYKASRPFSYKKRSNWEQVLAVACSFVKKGKIENEKKEEWNVALNENSTDRSYLYGRLLAVADRIETQSFDEGEERESNAKRYMCAFSQRPNFTWKVIEENVQPYLRKLKTGSRIYYNRLLDEIYQKFTEEDFMSNKRLDGLYLLGFHSQSFELRKKHSNEDSVTEEENSNE